MAQLVSLALGTLGGWKHELRSLGGGRWSAITEISNLAGLQVQNEDCRIQFLFPFLHFFVAQSTLILRAARHLFVTHIWPLG